MIRLHGVRKQFGQRVVLDGLEMQINSGEIYGLLGPNGCGKSTTINLICGRLQADGGEISVSGSSRSAAGADWLGAVSQEAALYPQLTCRQNLNFFASVYGLDRRSRASRIDEILSEFDLQAHADQPAGELSGGWRRRLHVAIAVVHQPRLLILDEPTASVDPAARRALSQIIRHQRAAGTTVLLTTHHLDEAEQLCDRVGILHRGRLLIEDTPAAIRSTVPAQQIAVIEADDIEPVAARATALGLRSREVGGRIEVLLPVAEPLADCIRRFDGLHMRALSLTPVTLEHAYLLLTDGNGAAAEQQPPCHNRDGVRRVAC